YSCDAGRVENPRQGSTKRLAVLDRQRLSVINEAEDIGEINLPGYNLHPLTGNRQGQWAITISGNWRVTFEFIDGDAYIVNYEDYH
ncbi:type II toxin-antitoxin system RelE/ParE family toxin, partial [Photorhabdus asymbiotica]